MTPEGKVKALVKRGFKEVGDVYAFMPVQNGMGAPSLDFVNCFRGLFFAVETKVVGKELTPRQKITAKAMCAAGAAVFVIRTANDVAHMVAHLRSGSYPAPPNGYIYDTMWTGD